MAKRIQRKRTAGWRMPPSTRYVGRPTRWGNPWKATEANALAKYERWAKERLQEDPTWLLPLRGVDLACWCRPGSPCHADVLLELLKALRWHICKACRGTRHKRGAPRTRCLSCTGHGGWWTQRDRS